MKDVIPIGDAMIALNPSSTGTMRFVSSFDRKVGGAELYYQTLHLLFLFYLTEVQVFYRKRS